MSPQVDDATHRHTRLIEAGFYGRVSGESEESIDIQLALAREFAARDGYSIPDRNVYTDIRVSGDREDRPGFTRLEKNLLSGSLGFSRLYIRDRQRFARWPDPRLFDYYIVHFQKHGLEVHFCDVAQKADFSKGVTDADLGHYIVEKVENLSNAKERTDIARKMQRARRQHLIDGAWPAGSWPYALDRVLVNKETGEVECFVPWGQKLIRPGFRYELRFATDRRIEAVKFVFQRIEEGFSIRAIVAELKERQLPPPRREYKKKPPKRPSSWTPGGVSRIARNAIYTGTIVYSKWNHRDYWRTDDAPPPQQDGTALIVLPERIPCPPITPEQFASVRSVLEAHAYEWKRRQTTSPKYLLTGMIRCAVCGRLFQGTPGIQVIYQHMPRYEGYDCPEILKRIHGLDQIVLEAIRDVALDPRLERRVQDEIRAFEDGNTERTKVIIDKLEEDLATATDALTLLEDDLNKFKDELARARACARIDKQAAVVASLKHQLEVERASEDAIAAATRAEPLLPLQHSVIRDVLDSGDRDALRILISNITERISARPSTREVEIALRYS